MTRRSDIQPGNTEPAHTVASGTTDTASTTAPDPYAATARETTEGRVYTVTGGDWDSLSEDFQHDERIVINMGPQHPSTHGVLRLVLELEGEVVTQARSVIGYLHTGIEKNVEY
ncbi:MAG TPA: NADH dehydrogenase subunit D, partial [Pseudonocardiaceae bacterium]